MALAVMRVTRLICLDQITMPLRAKVLNKNGDTGWWTFLIHCPLCVSVYVGAVAAVLYYYEGHQAWVVIPALALAFSQLTIFVNHAEVL